MENVSWFLYSSGYLMIGVCFIYLAKKIFDAITSYSLDVQLTEKDNPAVGIVLSGFIMGVAAIICGTFAGESSSPSWLAFRDEMGAVALYGLAGLLYLFIAGVINDKVVLRSFRNHDEIVKNRNIAVALVMGTVYFGSGLVVAGSIYGSSDLLVSLYAFAAGQTAMTLYAIIYQKVTRYDDQEQLGKKKNIAVALAFSGNLLAYSLILMRGMLVPAAQAAEWTLLDRLEHFGYYAGGGCVLLLVSRVLCDKLILPKIKLHEELIVDRNINAGLMESAVALSLGLILTFCL